jgi:putative ABC transport system permease protein
MLLKFALRNVLRNPRRTFLTSLIIVFGTLALILAGGFASYSYWGIRESFIRGQYGHIQVYHQDYFKGEEDYPLQFAIESPNEIISKIEKLDHVRFAMPRIGFTGLISNGEKSIGFLGKGIVSNKEQRLSSFSHQMQSGQYLGVIPDNDLDYEVMLASGVAKQLKAKKDDYLTLMGTTTSGAINAIDVKVCGIFATGTAELDKRMLYVSIETAQLLLNSNKVSSIVVSLDKTENTDKLANQISGILPNQAIKRWIDLASFYKSVMKLYNAIFYFLGAMIFCLVAISITNTMVMSVMERTREIATSQAIGMSPITTLKLFLQEGLIIGAASGFIGLILSVIISLCVNLADIQMPPPPGNTSGYPLGIRFEWILYIGTFTFMTFTSVLASVVPAFKAVKMNIVKALHHI